jgi:hypothetical protein
MQRSRSATIVLLAAAVVVTARSQDRQAPALFPVVVNGKAGYIDRTGALVIAPRFEGYFHFEDGLAQVSLGRDSGYAFIDPAGKIVLRPRYDIVREFSEGLAAVGNGQKRNPVNGLIEDPGKWGYIDKAGVLVIPLQFTHAESFSEGLAGVNVGEQGGFIDRNGKLVFSVPLDVSLGFQNGVVLVQSGGQESYYNRAGHRIPTPRLIRGTGESFTEGLAAVRIDEKWGYMDTAGTVVIPPAFLEAEPFSDGLAAVEVPIDLVWCPKQPDGSSWGTRKRYGYIDRTGRMVIPPLSDYPDTFSEGLAVISVCSKPGFIDRTGAVVLQPPFRTVSGFRNGLAGVESAEGRGYIDRTGRIVWKPSK